MRPVRLVAEGFGALRDRVELDFGDADFFALVGPTGSGKSTVIDAICFALYNSIPRYGDERQVAAAISARALETKVELEFTCGTERFRIVRVVRRTKSGAPNSTVQLDRLAHDDSVAETLAASVREAKERVAEIVGLGFDQFTKCVVLPQGAFAAFLHESEARRNDLLVRLLDLRVYERIAQLAGRRTNELDNEIEIDTRTAANLGVADGDALGAAAARVADLVEVFAASDELVARDGMIAAELDALRDAIRRSEAASAALDGIVVPAELIERVAARAAVAAALRQAEVAAASARSALEIATAQLEARTPSAQLRAALERYDRLAALDDELAAALVAATSAERVLAAAVASDEAALAAEVVAVAERDALQREHAAHELAAHLEVGAPCPVCEQPVGSLPARSAPATLAAAAKAMQDARAAHAATSAARSKADREHAAAEARVDALTEQHATAVATSNAQPDRSTIEAELIEVESLETAVEKARADAGVERENEQTARDKAQQLESASAADRRAFHDQRDALARAGIDDVPAPSGELGPDWAALVAFADERRSAEAAAVEAARAGYERFERDRCDLVHPLRDRVSSLGIVIPPDASLTAAREVVRDAGTRARLHHERLVADRELSAALSLRLETNRRDVEVARELHRHLGAKRFESWLLRRAVSDLAARASDRLLELSGGRYALTVSDKGEFSVVDGANANDVRPARSLSGGETFQASLALALALADHVAEVSASGSSTLESIFLDEGFGTLDPEALEVVAGTIEQLGATDRMVGIVTHVAALADRVPLRFRVANDGRTATITPER